jgi:hypothetical protein
MYSSKDEPRIEFNQIQILEYFQKVANKRIIEEKSHYVAVL